MNSCLVKLLPVLLCLALMCGCAAGDNTSDNSGAPYTPDAENTTPNDTGKTDESGDSAADEPEPTPTAALTSEEIAQWESYFNEWRNNGLLRFPYEELEEDPDQLAPYLCWLFYDIGETEISDRERELLAQEGCWLETDVFRLSREFLNDYLFEYFNIPAEKTENLLDAAKLGTYIMGYDAWYTVHGDTEYNLYTIQRGEIYEDGTIKLYYLNNFLRVLQENGEMDYVDANMVVVLSLREDGSRYISAHRIGK